MAKRVKEKADQGVPAERPGPRLPADAAVGAYPEGLLPEMFTPLGDARAGRRAAGDGRLFRPRAALPLLEQGAGRLARDAALARSSGGRAIEITGEEAFREREPLIRAALAGERQAVSSTYDHPTRGTLALQSEYIPWRDAAGEVQGFIAVVDRRHRAARRRAGAEGERGAVPADRGTRRR